MVKDKSTLTHEVVKEQYEELLTSGLPFLQIFPEMIQESNVAEKLTLPSASIFRFDTLPITLLKW